MKGPFGATSPEAVTEKTEGGSADRAGRAWKAASSHPWWWGVALLCTLSVDRPLLFLYHSWLPGPGRGIFPALEELLPERGMRLGSLAVALFLFLTVKALDYLGQASLIGLTAGSGDRGAGPVLEESRRAARSLIRYVAALAPLDLLRYFFLSLTFLVWAVWRRYDPQIDHWCAYLCTVLGCLAVSLPLYLAVGIWGELAGRALLLDGEKVTGAWEAALSKGWGNRRAVASAWSLTVLADLAAAVCVLAGGLTASWLSMLIRGDAGWMVATRRLASAAVVLLFAVFLRVVLSIDYAFRCGVWTDLWVRHLSEGDAGVAKQDGSA